MNRSFLLVVLVATVLGGLLRFHELAEPSLWNDELFTVRDAFRLDEVGPMKKLSYVPTRLALELYGVDAEQAGAAGYGGWRALGISEFRIRVASCLIGVLSVLALGLAGRLVLSLWAAGCTALLLAWAPWHVEWSQNARFYIQLFFFYNLSLILYYRGSRERSPRLLGAALLSALAALMSHATAMMIFGVFAVDVLHGWVRERRLPLGRSNMLMLGLAFAVAFGIAAFSFLTRTVGFIESLTRDDSISPLRFGFDLLLTLGAPLVVLALVGAWQLWREERGLGVYLGAAVVVPIVCFCLLALQTFVSTRYVFVSLYAWLALAAVGGEAMYRLLRDRLGQIAALAPLICLFAAMSLVHTEYFGAGYGYRARYKHAFRYIAERRGPDDLVYSTNAPGAQYYLSDPEISGDPLYDDFSDLADIDTPVWFVVSTTSYDQGAGRRHPLDDQAALRAVFGTRVRYPQTTLRVYYRPAPAAPVGSAAAPVPVP